MAQSTREGIKGVLILAAVIGLPFVLIANAESSESNPTPKTVCSNVVVPFMQEQRESSIYYIGQSFVSIKGVNGVRRICKDSERGHVVSSTVLVKPINQVTIVGTQERPAVQYQAPSSGYRTGARCNDGTYSSATGRGACSWHGGVSQWLYE